MTLPDDIKAYNRQLIEDFRARNGDLGGRAVLLLTTTGRRSGRPHTTPMMYVRDGDKLYVIASNAGAVRHPDWYLNLVANPDVRVEIAGESYEATAVPLEGEERDRVFDWIADQYTFFRDHQAGIKRKIPVVSLVRKG